MRNPRSATSEGFKKGGERTMSSLLSHNNHRVCKYRITGKQPPTCKPMRAVIEIVGGELAIYPISDCDTDEKIILDALRFVADGDGRSE
jgi:hypothetical protein